MNNFLTTPTKKIKILIWPFIFIFLMAFFILNGKEITWVLNSRYLVAFLSQLVSAEKTTTAENIENRDENIVYVEKEDSIFIPKIQVQAPLVFSVSDRLEDMKKALDKGVVHYPSSALPGEKGRVIILGHSAPPDWPKIKYYHVFNDLNTLKEGDEVFVYFRNREYKYRVTGKFFAKAGTQLDSLPLTNSEKYVLLLSCWPPGQREQRIIIEAQ